SRHTRGPRTAPRRRCPCRRRASGALSARQGRPRPPAPPPPPTARSRTRVHGGSSGCRCERPLCAFLRLLTHYDPSRAGPCAFPVGGTRYRSGMPGTATLLHPVATLVEGEHAAVF